MIESERGIEAFSGIRIGRRPSRAHDFVFVAEREVNQCALLVGQELRDDWGFDDRDESFAGACVLARADEIFLPLQAETVGDGLERFSRGFREVMMQTQQELQAGAKDSTGGAPSVSLSLAYIEGRALYLGQVGNNPSYLVRSRRVHRITAAGPERLSDIEQPLVRDPSLLSNADLEVVGGFSDDLDTHTLAVSLKPDDLIILCTRGVTAGVPEPILEEALLARGRAEEQQPLDAIADAIFRLVPQGSPAADRGIALARLPRAKEPRNESSPASSDR